MVVMDGGGGWWEKRELVKREEDAVGEELVGGENPGLRGVDGWGVSDHPELKLW